MVGLTPKDIKEIHKQLVEDIQETYEKEVSLLEDETRTIDMLKKYEKKIIVKHIFQKAKWKENKPESHKAYGPRNAYAKIIHNFYTLTSRLNNIIISQQHFLQEKLIKINEEYKKERGDTADLPLFEKEIKKVDKKALYTLRRLDTLFEEIYKHCKELSDGFLKSFRMAEIFSLNPQKFHKIFTQICRSIDYKNETLKILHKVMKYETGLQKRLPGEGMGDILGHIRR